MFQFKALQDYGFCLRLIAVWGLNLGEEISRRFCSCGKASKNKVVLLIMRVNLSSVGTQSSDI